MLNVESTFAIQHLTFPSPVGANLEESSSLPSVTVARMQALAVPLLLLALLTTPESSAQPAVNVVPGRCAGCDRPYRLGRFQFVDAMHGWADGFFVVVSGNHISQYGTILHTNDGGKHWAMLKSVETYGVELDPAFWFTGSRGCIAWPVDYDAMGRFICTNDGGRRWRDLPVSLPGTLVHLRFFDSRHGVAAASTSDGARFDVTANGGLTWIDTAVDLAYPDALVFLNPRVGWIAGIRPHDDVIIPRVFSTIDGGETWHAATFPPSTIGNPHDLFFVDSERGWLILWNARKDNARNASVLLQTIDGGHSWKEAPIAAPGGGRLFFQAVRFLSPEVGFVFVTDAGGIAFALATRDGGRTWQKVHLPSVVQSCEIVKNEVWCSSGMDLFQLRPGEAMPASR